MKGLYIYPYRMGSKSATALARALDIAQIRHARSKFRGASNKVVINWGSGDLPVQARLCRVLNKVSAVSVARDKLQFFRSQSRGKARMVPWTDSVAEAEQWLKKDYTVVARKSLTSHSGHGIIIVKPGEKLPPAPLYTRYISKDEEYRIHIVGGQVTDVQRKIRDPDREPKDWKVRSHDNGFIFVRGGVNPSGDVRAQALAAYMASGLDFGAFDIIWNKKQGQAYVLEANTAPGLEGHSVGLYASAFKKLVGKGR